MYVSESDMLKDKYLMVRPCYRNKIWKTRRKKTRSVFYMSDDAVFTAKILFWLPPFEKKTSKVQHQKK